MPIFQVPRSGLVQRDLCTTTKFLIQCRKRRWSEAMARRDFRQLGLADSIVRRRGKKSEWLDRLDAALDWPALEAIVAGIYASPEFAVYGHILAVGAPSGSAKALNS